MRLPSTRGLLFLFILPIAAPHRFSAQTATIDNNQPFSLSAPELVRLATAAPGEPPSDVTIFLDEDLWSFDEAGRGKHSVRVIFRVATQQAVEGWSSVKWGWKPWYEHRPVIKARVVSPAGVASELDPKTLVDSPASESDNTIYSDRRVLRGPRPEPQKSGRSSLRVFDPKETMRVPQAPFSDRPHSSC